MAITLDAATEERIQHQLDRVTFPGPTELLAHASTSSKKKRPQKTG